MQKRWIFNEDFDGDAINTLQQELNVSHTLAKLINQKGISSFNEAKSFFRPTLDQLHDPFLMKDMDRAVNRLT